MRCFVPASAALVLAITSGCASQAPAPEQAPERVAEGAAQAPVAEAGAESAAETEAATDAASTAASEAGSTSAPAPSKPVAPRHAIRPRPEDDLRYTLPPGEDRKLKIFISSQTYEYTEDGRVIASGDISSGSAQYPTPTGSFRVQSKDKNKRSSKYYNYYGDNTPMPYSLQFHGPYFVHEGWLPGFPDSHGCVRLHYEDARFLYERMRVGDPVLVESQGQAATENPWGEFFPTF